MTRPGTLIDAATLAVVPRAVVVDCRFVLGCPERGAADYASGHIPGAVHADLDRDLSRPASTDRGRHPLPPPARLNEVFGRLGIGRDSQVVAYDAADGMFAARLWWMLRYMGHDAVAVLDGGLEAWCRAGYPVEVGVRVGARAPFDGKPRVGRLVQLGEMIATVAQRTTCPVTVVDARDPARYRGELEPLDPRAGHMPGARNHCFRWNLAADRRFLAPSQLRKAFAGSLGKLPDASTVHYCGSGVSACHNVLAQVHAGLPEPRMYCGSWSEWSRDPQCAVATGDYTP